MNVPGFVVSETVNVSAEGTVATVYVLLNPELPIPVVLIVLVTLLILTFEPTFNPCGLSDVEVITFELN